jgi:ubiquinone/menaquinone biosynthesis C-methylase UbiE
MTVAQALLHIADGDTEAARRSCEQAAHASLLAQHLVSHLVDGAADDVYTDPAAFERFISGGSNVDLYDATIMSLREVNERNRPTALIDIGCGDGRITAAALPTSVETVHLLEPSAALLSSAVGLLRGTGTQLVTISSNLQDYLAEEPNQRWDCAQATFALHNLPPDDRPGALARLMERVRTLSLVEFDVPDFADKSPEHATYAAEAYEIGAAEYADDRAVIDGFLLPVLLGQFALNRQRHTHEQSAHSWANELTKVGFQSVTIAPICDYWWANAVLITGIGAHSENA